jgi:hypothetical protein
VINTAKIPPPMAAGIIVEAFHKLAAQDHG